MVLHSPDLRSELYKEFVEVGDGVADAGVMATAAPGTSVFNSLSANGPIVYPLRDTSPPRRGSSYGAGYSLRNRMSALAVSLIKAGQTEAKAS